jgi:gamma-polyglutamate biosynthesis protein CapA
MQKVAVEYRKNGRPMALFLFLLFFIAAAGLFFLVPEEKQYSSNSPLPLQAPPRPFSSTELSEEPEPVRIAFVGDIMLDRYIRHAGAAAGYDYIFDNVAPLLKKSDMAVGNLEGPVTAYDSLSVTADENEGAHYTFTFSPQSLGVLYKNNIRTVSIGNNHILDFGLQGLQQTRSFLQEYGIAYFGDPHNDQNSLIKEIKGKKIGFVAFNQFRPYEKVAVEHTIRRIAAETDFVAVFAHWGEEYNKIPNDAQILLGRSFVDAGADLVIGTHPHVIQGKEPYKGGIIYYSLGNFVFDQYFNDAVRCGAVISVILPNAHGKFTLEETFIRLENNGSTVISACASEVPNLTQIQE